MLKHYYDGGMELVVNVRESRVVGAAALFSRYAERYGQVRAGDEVD